MKTTVGQILVNSVLPSELRDYRRRLDKKTVKELFDRIAREYPDRYAEILKRLNDIGRIVATYYGGPASIGTDDLRQSPELRYRMNRIRERVREIVRTTPPEQRSQKIVQYLSSVMDELRKLNLETGLKDNNAFALQIASGSRGNETQFASLRLGKFIVVDHKQRPLPIPILHGFAEGLTPAEIWVNTYGARMGEVVKKEATPTAGFLGKQLALAAHRLVVTEKDCGAEGMTVSSDDKDIIGSVLAKSYGEFPAGTVITPKVLNRLKKNYKELLVRSPITCRAEEGVCQKCAGIRENGDFPNIGDNIGITAANAIAEPIAQSQICLEENTLVLMADWSFRPIKHIRPGEMVMGADRYGQYRPVRVLNVFDNGEQECNEYIFKYGRGQHSSRRISVICTPMHKFATRRKNQKNGCYIYEICPIGQTTKQDRFVYANTYDSNDLYDIDIAELLGLIVACGRIVDNKIVLKLSRVSKDIVKLITDKLDQFNAVYESDYICHNIEIDLQKSVLLKNKLNEHMPNLAPESIYLRSWPTSSIINFVTGLFLAKGSIVQRRYDYSIRVVLYIQNDNQEFADELEWVLRHRLAIHSSFKLISGKRKKHYLCFISQYESVRRFFSLVRLYGKRKFRKISVLRQAPFPSRDVSYGWMLHDIRSIGRTHTYDIEVESEEHLFVLANGLIVSNSAKHTAGALGSTSAISGLKGIEQFVQVPKHFPAVATLATVEGRVSSIQKNPQGGWSIIINGVEHYVEPDKRILVKVGDAVEAGDQLSDGIPNPADITRYKGIGEARKYFVEQFSKILADSGIKANKRNIELLARGLINHVRMTNETEGLPFLPNDIVEYDAIARRWVPRKGAYETRVSRSIVGKYLEKPILHYTIGTKLTRGVVDKLKKAGIKNIVVHDEPPPFEPEMRRAMESVSYSEDWMTRLGDFFLQRALLDSAHRGSTSKTTGVSYIPALAKGIDFGKFVEQSGKY